MSAVGGFPARPHRVLRNPRLVDVIVAGLLTAGALSALSSLSYRGSVALAVGSCVVCTGTVAFRRRAPVITSFVAVTAMLVYQRTTRDPQGPFESVAVVLTLFMSGRRGIGRANPAPLAVLLAYALAACALISGGSSVFGVALSWVLLAVLPMAAGATVARRGELTRDLADTAARLKDEQEMRAARAAGEERNRVARDLHDVVAHSVSVMVIQAGAARLVADADPSAARAALGVVEASGREAMADLRRIMGVLRRGDDALAGPPVGLAQLNGLIDRIRVGGVPTELRVEGQPGPLPSDVGLVAYRVVQEALTNVVKHAGPCCARVRVSFEAHALDLHVTDTGTGPTSEHPQLTKPGHGLVGMRERVALYGGELRTGHRADGGYEVWARLPVVPTGPRQRTSCPDLPSRPGTEAPRPSSRRWLDWAFASAWLVAMEIEALTSADRRGPVALNVVVVAAMALASLWRRRAPLLFLAVVGVLAVPLGGGLTSLDTATLTGAYVLVVPLYTVAAWEPRPRATAGLAVWTCGAAGIGIARQAPLGGVAGALVMACAVWAAGRVIRAQRELVAELEHTSARLAAEREDHARLAVAGERSRIARELHALVANGVIVMVIQAEVAQNLLDRDLHGALAAVSAIERTGREALAQMRHILGVLRARHDARELRPQPGLDQIHALIQRSREGGQHVELTIDGEPGPLFAGVDLVTYRIIEEVLGKADRPTSSPLLIALRFDEETIELDLSALGAAPTTWPTPAIRERVALCDGEIRLASDSHTPQLIVRLPRKPQGALA